MEIKIIEAYEQYTPPFNVAKVVRQLLRPIPEKYGIGLSSIVLTSQAALPRKDRIGKTRSRKRKHDKSRILGRYHYKWQGKEAWIEIRVDKAIENWANPSKWFWILPMCRQICIGEVLYHELGHHAHYCVRPEFEEKEDVAETWKKRFMNNFMRKKYWWALPILVPLAHKLRPDKAKKS